MINSELDNLHRLMKIGSERYIECPKCQEPMTSLRRNPIKIYQCDGCGVYIRTHYIGDKEIHLYWSYRIKGLPKWNIFRSFTHLRW